MENYSIEKKALYDSIKAEEKSRNTILTIMQKFAEATDVVDINSVDKIKEFLENLKRSLNLSNENIEILKRLINDVNDISIPVENKLEPIVDSEEIKNEVISITKENVEATEETKYNEDTLVVSEISGKVILPYKIFDLNKELKDSKSKYSSIDDIIQEKYTLPLSLFKNPFVSRFRESFKLMRNREKSSIKEAFDLGLELMFNYNLHPAIISSCKNVDELDIYLDYLDNGEIEKFDIFKIVFEATPTVVKAKHEF